MRRQGFKPPAFFSLPDLVIALFVGTMIYGLASVGNLWRADFQPVTEISLEAAALPYYTLLSAFRGIVAYVLSLTFTLVVGYIAAKWKPAEKFMLPLMDILQSIPVLVFLPGLVLGLIAVFPRSNVGLELACVLMIFLGQFSNMLFSFYGSLKNVPTEFNEAATLMGLSWWQKLLKVELPFAAVDLAWNSLYSMAGGWFFLSVCEAFTLRDLEFRLPGIGAYMAVAMRDGNIRAMIYGIVAMTALIIVMDFFIWRPILSWVQRFRLDEVAGAEPDEPMMQIVIRESRIVRWLKLKYRDWSNDQRVRRLVEAQAPTPALVAIEMTRAEGGDGDGESATELRLRLGNQGISIRGAAVRRGLRVVQAIQRRRLLSRALRTLALLAVIGLLLRGFSLLILLLSSVHLSTWVLLVRNTVWTLLRVVAAIMLASLWAVPAGIWIGTSPRRVRIFQPIVQIVASFPAPMLYPLALVLFFSIGIHFDWGSMLLMMLGVQFYVLINVLSGALRVPRELLYATQLMNTSRWDRWRRLYLPSVFPQLVTGWITAAGGAWNASIVAEFVQFRGTTYETGGLGATITTAAANKDFPLLAAAVTVMVLVVVLLNRTFWSRLYDLSQTRFRMEM